MNEWRDKAECRGLDPNLFFPAKHSRESIAAAKDICNICNVRTECLNAYFWSNDKVIAGGTTWRERQALKRQQVRQPKG